MLKNILHDISQDTNKSIRMSGSASLLNQCNKFVKICFIIDIEPMLYDHIMCIQTKYTNLLALYTQPEHMVTSQH